MRGRSVGLLLADGVDAALLERVRRATKRAGAHLTLVAGVLAGVTAADGTAVPADAALAGTPSCVFDAVLVLGAEPGIAALACHPAATDWVRDAWRHLKAIGHDAAGLLLLQAAGLGGDAAVVPVAGKGGVDRWVAAAAAGRHFAREGAPGTDS